jgi:hypothetical protein
MTTIDECLIQDSIPAYQIPTINVPEHLRDTPSDTREQPSVYDERPMPRRRDPSIVGYMPGIGNIVRIEETYI